MILPFLCGIVVVALLALGVLFAKYLPRIRVQMREPENNPRTFIQRGRQTTTRTLVVCAGDSITHGVVSANYVEMLERRFAADGYEFVNAGINGNLAYNLLQRLEDVIACRPDVVTVLIGTNDVNATFSQAWEDTYRKEQKLPAKPTIDWYRLNVERIIDRLQAETAAQIVILDLPMLGEDLASDTNRRVADYNAVLRAVAAEKQVTCLPLRERLGALLPQNHTPPPYQGKKGPVLRVWIKHFMQRKSWDAVSADHGLELLTDHIHLNDRAAAVIAALIGDFLDDLRKTPALAADHIARPPAAVKLSDTGLHGHLHLHKPAGEVQGVNTDIS